MFFAYLQTKYASNPTIESITQVRKIKKVSIYDNMFFKRLLKNYYAL